MSTIPYDTPEETWEGYDDEEPLGLPRRRRRQFLTRTSALLFAAIVGGACFYAGVRVEKGQVSASASPLSALASAARAAGGATGAGGAAGRSGRAASLFGGSGGRSGFFSGAFGGGAGTFGTVSSVNGNKVYVTEEPSGNVVMVTLSSATTITKSKSAAKSAIRPGDSVTVEGVKGSNGSVAATSVSDSGTRSGGTGTSSSSSTSGSGSAVGSLFGGGG